MQALVQGEPADGGSPPRVIGDIVYFVRNVFDQYSQPENRLTHALACCLHEDDVLARELVRWLTARPTPEGDLHIVEQSLPGQPSADDDGARDSLPDAWIYSDDGWSLLLESKVQAPIDVDQLRS